ncbi:hypothetical protein HX088_06965 [Empedobacter sp. 225-1]|uniref:DUF6331 family protein n=1 Tax=unclassified Empedobacter TaxID=2643773 RepID=UPI002574BDA9|nr:MULTISPECIES: DUF6331 family protein [unclassified Empedobacter]MDM1523010.1 hypothetical protein [Empedobacter sp. 225-1]MDM1543010.1 hypothetical protein [Empedobacter sp. 189-2]
MTLIKEIQQSFEDSEVDKAYYLLNNIDFSKLSNEKRIIQSSLIQLSQGKIDSLYMFLKLIYKKEKDIIQAAVFSNKNIHCIDDIKIDEDKYIKWIPLEKDIKSINIDNLLVKTYSFWESLSTECVFECCGISACDFTSDTISKTVKSFDVEELLINFNDLIIEIESFQNNEIYSNYLNQYFNKDVFLELVQHIKFQIELNLQ